MNDEAPFSSLGLVARWWCTHQLTRRVRINSFRWLQFKS